MQQHKYFYFRIRWTKWWFLVEMIWMLLTGPFHFHCTSFSERSFPFFSLNFGSIRSYTGYKIRLFTTNLDLNNIFCLLLKNINETFLLLGVVWMQYVLLWPPILHFQQASSWLHGNVSINDRASSISRKLCTMFHVPFIVYKCILVFRTKRRIYFSGDASTLNRDLTAQNRKYVHRSL